MSEALDKYVKSQNINSGKVTDHWDDWRKWLKSMLLEFSATRDILPYVNDLVNPYKLVEELTNILPEYSITVCSDGTACVVGFQAAMFKEGQRMFHNSGCASMGYELPAAIGAYHAKKKVITCLAGDGSIMMNMQELSIIAAQNYPIKIILINNSGYHSIRQTQSNYFPDNQIGCGAESGLAFPQFSELCRAFGIKYLSVTMCICLLSHLKAYSDNSPCLVEVFVNQEQTFSPKLASKKLNLVI